MGRLKRWHDAVRLMGPAFLVSVAYLDPGNWATAIEGGSRFGYELVWVVVLSNLIAILLQTLAARLGLITGKHLALLCRQEYPRLVCVLLWVLCEISIVALDLTMVIGTAVGLNLLFRLPLLPCILLSGLDSLLLLLMVPSLGLRKGEMLTVGLIMVVVCCFLWDLILSNPPLTELVSGLWPRLSRDSLYTAVSLLGANVMPHNFYLHSALVSGQASQIGRAGCSVADLCRFNQMDITAALGVALLVNVAVMLVAAATFHSAGVTVRTLQDAHDVMEQLLSSSVAPKVFGMALLCAGQLSTFTGTISGQVVLKGFMNISLKPWMRRLLTRSSAIIPASIIQVYYGSAAIYQMLLIAQVILALQLPFTLVPLIKITSSKSHMGAFANSRLVQSAAWGATLLIFAANLFLCMELIWPHSSDGGPEDGDGAASWSLLLIGSIEDLLAGQTLLLALAYTLFVVGAAAGLSLLLWMIITPLKDDYSRIDLSVPKLASRAFEWLGDKRGGPSHHRKSDSNSGSGSEDNDYLLDLDGDCSYDQRGWPGTGTGTHSRGHQQQQHKQEHLEEVVPHGGAAKAGGSWSEAAPPDSWEELEMIDIVTERPLEGSAAAEASRSQQHQQGAARQGNVNEGMGQGVRRQCAAVLNGFWAELYDLHGQPAGDAAAAGRPDDSRAPFLQPEHHHHQLQQQEAPEGEHQRRVQRCLKDLCTEGGTTLLRRHCRDNQTLAPFELYVASLCPVAGGASAPELELPLQQQQQHLAAAPSLGPVSSFGVWCILRLLQLLQEEPRPELWGRYGGVLNRLQGVVLWQMPADPRADQALAAALMGYVGAAESHVQGRSGPAGTAAGEFAFPKGKEIAGAVLKRYRRLLTRSSTAASGAGESATGGTAGVRWNSRI